MTFRERHHAVWRELLNCEPLNAEDGQFLLSHLTSVQVMLVDGPWAQERLAAAENYLEERAFLMSRMTPEQRSEVDAYRVKAMSRVKRDAWQKKSPRLLTKAEHDELLGVEVGATKPVDREEYERMMREAQE